jgi:hypothetical protein
MKVRLNKADDGGNGKSAYKKELYTSWGDQADAAHGQGWFPETNYNGETTYRSSYDLFNKVQIPSQQQLGHVAIVGRNNNMDVVIRDANGNIVKKILEKVSPKDVQSYLTNQQSVASQRQQSIQQGTNIDKPDEKGNFAYY